MRFLVGSLTAAIMTLIFGVFYAISIPFDRNHRSFSFIAYWWSRAVFAVTGVSVRVEGLDLLDKSRPYIYVSNHASLFDITAVVLAIDRRVRFVAKREVARVPIFGWAAARENVMLDRKSGTDSAHGLQKAAGRIALGQSVIVFAEGTRTRDGNLLPFKRGAFLLATQAGVPVVPLTILGSYRIMKKGHLHVNKGVITIVVHQPVDVTPFRGRHGAMELMQRVRDIIERTYTKAGHAGLQPTLLGS